MYVYHRIDLKHTASSLENQSVGRGRAAGYFTFPSLKLDATPYHSDGERDGARGVERGQYGGRAAKFQNVSLRAPRNDHELPCLLS